MSVPWQTGDELAALIVAHEATATAEAIARQEARRQRRHAVLRWFTPLPQAAITGRGSR